MINSLKTIFLLGALTGLFLLLGNWIGGNIGLTFALIIAACMNFFLYFYSDKIVLSMYKAKPLDQIKYRFVYEIVEELTDIMNISMPKLWYMNTSMINAFATGRNHKHASIALTQGILDTLEEHELRGVLAHELSHIKNRDILIVTIAATIVAAIGYLANMLQWSVIFGGHRNDKRDSNIGAFFVAIIMPFAATLIQLAISRSREYMADETGAKFCQDPLSLVSALEKIHYDVKQNPVKPRNKIEESTASLFIVSPFMSGAMLNLLSTHPPMEKRIERLKKMVL